MSNDLTFFEKNLKMNLSFISIQECGRMPTNSVDAKGKCS